MSSESSSSDKPSGVQPPADLKRIGKYQISRRLGAGGMGIVYLATDSELKRTVALKVLSQDRANNPILVRRFKSEGQAAALLQHKNIVSVYEAGEADGYLFLALEFVDGIDLLEWVNRRGPIPVKRTVEIIRQAAEALQHAFERNIVHRDIKPSNLMIARDGSVKLTDMGLARSIDETLDTTITRDGTTVGTVDYMAPEQASNSKAADIRSDIYSLGCTWYHLLTGQPPFPDGSVTNKISAHISSPIPDPSRINSNVPEPVVAVIHRMLAKKKEQRYQTPAELLEDLSSPTLRRTQDAPNLLAMFGDEFDSDSSDDLVSVKPARGNAQANTTSAVGDAVKSQRKRTPKNPDFSSMQTRAEIPAARKSDPRAKLVRLDVQEYSRDPVKNLPWGLMVLGVLLISAVLLIRYLISAYVPAPEVIESSSPYTLAPPAEAADAPPENADSSADSPANAETQSPE
ncbi:serine/threonine protein kinase [Planctomicrobium sp. SH661]|uniref:serine/threonine protein kinase n=1 Tax=Planctomicrobium sp. SH661 TaxID=3448124 RepID=UPI003F5CA295